MRKHAVKFVTLLAILFAAAFLVPQRASADDDDPPARVARLSHTDGSVSFDPAGTEDWVSAVINRPITTGDKLWADRNSRAELQLGSASIRMGSNTGFSFLNLSDNIAQLQLTAGTLRIRVRRLERDEQFEVDTPNLAFSIFRPGIYRITVDESGETTYVDVRSGEGSVTGGGQSYDLREGDSGTFSGTEQLNADIQGLPGDDDFDAWCDERDRRQDHSVSGRYVSEDAVGYEDLDDYGGWRDTPDYGTVWFPHTTVVGWAPYRYGHWAYIFPWGYTWVDDEPWGFAPFHYGRWVVVGGVWGWVPCRPAAVGVVYVRPVYAPALVAWVGGPHFAIGVGVGGAATVGWFPLGPREVYVPSYRTSRTYVNNVNITNTTVNTTVINNYYNTTVVNNNTTVTNIKYVNQGVPGAVTAAPARAVATAQPISRNVVHVDERQIASAPVVVKAPAVAPERRAVLGTGQPTSVRPPAQVVTRPVVAKTTPPPPPPRFETQQTLIKQNGGQPPPLSEIRQKYANDARQTAVRIAPPAKPATPQGQERNAQQNNRPGNAPQNNARPGNNQPPQNNERANERPNNPAQNQQANRPQNNERPANNRPPQSNERPAERPNNPAQNEQANRPQNNERPANNQPPQNNERPNNQRQYSDRPPSSRPSDTSPNQYRNEQQLERQHQQELENMHKQQDQQRQQLEQKQQQEHQQLQQQKANDRQRQQVEQQHQQQLQDMQRQHQSQQQQLNQRQQQEHQQQRQQDRPPQAPPRQQERPPQQQQRQQQQEHSKPPEKPSKP